MRQFFALFVIFLLVLNVSSIEKKKKHHKKVSTESTNESEQDDIIDMLAADEIAAHKEENGETVDHGDREAPAQMQPLVQEDPCFHKHCGAGRVCQLNSKEEAECVCIEQCGKEVDPRRRVCTNYNETFESDCEVYQARCFCDTEDPRCRGPDYQHVHIEYYGSCKQMPACKIEDMSDFPRRMRDWLFNIMRDLADRQELSDYYLKMQREAESNHTLKWTNAAIWKWCDLDGHPHDRAVSRHELFPIRAPLMALEHCIAPFLDSCDLDNDHKITLQEWGRCLGIDEEELIGQCDNLAETHSEITHEH